MRADGELLRRYAEERSEEAFAELVRRYLDLVFSAARRQVNGDAALAEEVAQSVFIDLARKARLLSVRTNLTGWLYTSTHFAAAKAARAEQRRRVREREAQTMHDLRQGSAPEPDWEQVRPVLDEAMHELKSADREAILHRFFENRSLAEVGVRLGVKENAARMRVERALEKLRMLLSRRGVTTTAALSLILSTHAVHAAPTGMAGSLASMAFAGGAAGPGLIATLLLFMKKLKFALIAVILLLLTGTTIFVTTHSWNGRQRSLVDATPIATGNAGDTATMAAASPIAGVWNVEGKPYLDLQWDGQGKVTGTVVWWDGPQANRVPVESGTFDPSTGTLRLEGDGPVRDGVPARYVIVGTLENDSLSGEYAMGTRKGNFAFTK